ncbi:MAG: xanthine dehydrogenase family protein molybdopterin-binding subunit [Burkholderiales bacterium]
MGAADQPLRARTRVIGESVLRLEDGPLIRGEGRFAADLSFPHELHMRMVRSTFAHGRLLSIDTAAARATKGVVAVWTHADVADLPPIALREGPVPALQPYLQPILAREMVRYVGEPVAVVFATDPYLAEDAAELVEVRVEERPVLLDASAAPREFAPGLTTDPTIIRKDYGDVEAAFRDAHMVVSLDLSIGRFSGVPLETRGLLARYDPMRDVLELHGAAKIPHRNREALAKMLNRSPSSLQLYEWHVGGGFGVRGEIYPEDVLILVAALRLNRPIKWIEDRYEHLIAANQSREQRHQIRAAVDANGFILAIDDVFFHDQGAYIRTHGARVADMAAGMLPGPYRIPACRIAGHFRLTNKTPAATFRAPGRFEGTFVRERLVDAIADRLGIDPIEIRRRNLITASEMPFHRPMDTLDDEIEYDSGDYPKLLDRVLAASQWETLRTALKARRGAGECVGAAIALFVEKSGLGPMDGVRASIDSSGIIELITGGASVGQGFETVMAQICAEALGIAYTRVRVVHGRTDRIAYGVGAHASRATVMTGSATHIAALKLRAKLIDLAAELLDTAPESLDIADGQIFVKDVPSGPAITFADVARAAAPGSPALRGRDPGLSVEGWFRTEHMTFPYGGHMAVVNVDRDTGAVRVERFLVVYDVGRAVNPALIEGQVAGGVMQGMGGALYEEFRYDERGEPLSVTFADYLIPTLHEAPPIEIVLTEDAPSPLNPLGLKGAGEAGINGVGAVIAAAIDDALQMPGAITRLPVTPETIRALLRDGVKAVKGEG